MSLGNSATIYAAFLGAAAAALFQFLVGRSRTKRERHAVLRAIVAEIGVLAELIRVQYRPEGLSQIGKALAADPNARVFPIDLGGNFFTVYEALSDRLGYLEENHVETIVQFYTNYKIAIALASPADDGTKLDDAMIDLLLKLGDKVAAMPKDVRG